MSIYTDYKLSIFIVINTYLHTILIKLAVQNQILKSYSHEKSIFYAYFTQLNLYAFFSAGTP